MSGTDADAEGYARPFNISFRELFTAMKKLNGREIQVGRVKARISVEVSENTSEKSTDFDGHSFHDILGIGFHKLPGKREVMDFRLCLEYFPDVHDRDEYIVRFWTDGLEVYTAEELLRFSPSQVFQLLEEEVLIPYANS